MKPILFNTEMVRALLEGHKTVTRRDPFPALEDYELRGYCIRRIKGRELTFSCFTNGGERDYEVKAKFHPGDILWVRETWRKDVGRYMYRADYAANEKFYRNGKEVTIKWHPSIHMPREAARLFLRVTEVRVERLQDITTEQARAEDVIPNVWDSANEAYGYVKSKYIRAFNFLWNSTIKPAKLPLYGWEANPWVWVIAFERISKEEAQEADHAM